MPAEISAFLFTLLAGLSTGLGSLVAFFSKRTNRKFLSISLGFSAGVMIYISMAEIYIEAGETLREQLGKSGGWIAAAAFFGAMLLIALIEKLIPSEENPHEIKSIETLSGQTPAASRLMRTGLLTAIAIAIHNLPEGLALFISAMEGPHVAIPLVTAVAFHNIPVGIAISVPVYQATGSKSKALAYALFSGLAEPLGALLGWVILRPLFNEIILGILLAGVAGIMVYVSFDELLPSAREYGEHHLSLYGLIFGMVVMAACLLLFA